MTSPHQSLKNTIERLREKVGPNGYHEGNIAEKKAELVAAELAKAEDQATLLEWEHIVHAYESDLAIYEKAVDQYEKKSGIRLQ